MKKNKWAIIDYTTKNIIYSPKEGNVILKQFSDNIISGKWTK